MAVKLLGVLVVLAFALASTVVGGRLLWVARRTREAPELAMGLAFVVSGAIGFPLLIAAQAVQQASGPTAATHLLMALGAGFTFSGYVGLGVGCWRIFRPAARGRSCRSRARAPLIVARSWRPPRRADRAASS
jgi:hypothetical protein